MAAVFPDHAAHVKSTILVALLFRTLDAFRVFDLIYVLTGGGPANSTESISIYAYKTMFAQLNFGAGSALSVIVFLCIAIICMIYVKILGSDIIAKRGDRGKHMRKKKRVSDFTYCCSCLYLRCCFHFYGPSSHL